MPVVQVCRSCGAWFHPKGNQRHCLNCRTAKKKDNATLNREEAPKWFAEQMAVKLAENVHKGGWEQSDPWWLLDRLKEEVAELEDAMEQAGRGDLSLKEVIR